ncbi:MAG: glutamine synthetase III [Bacteroidetes bacterium]|nr:glutamine synthetase III [Bacteroidota bacterium]MDA1122314.1 glutamine synthetase III [Bacteroidota bacterium]
MAVLRFQALNQLPNLPIIDVKAPSEKVSDYFGENAFGLSKMKETLSPDVFQRVEHSIRKGKRIDEELANAIASAVKVWAISKGCTHYTHWFQPLTGASAEKHEAFFDITDKIEVFRGSALLQQEPDASSFPSGGIRSTFEARGYTAWDPSSPIFIIEKTLCIPTLFVSYIGEALDFKAPLLKAMEAIDNAATRVCQLFDRNVNKVVPSLGCEQEYFVIDRGLFNARPDLVMAGRTVFGHNPARGQQLDDHYFGSIPTRIYNFMRDFEIEAWKLGIPLSTRHNEVAPSQFEVASIFEDLNVATDHNQLIKDVMDKIARRHNLKVLFHEKPFAELNGNGKHNNWSLNTNTGVNLFQPTSSARDNLLFLIFFISTIKAVHDHDDLLRASVASAGNDLRLGINEAPPAIISVFIGTQLSAVLDELETNGNIEIEKGDNLYMKLGIDKVPEIILDNTDRNRTAPLAFTGNKFEFRAVGSDTNVAEPMMVLNTIVANQLSQFYKEVNKLMDNGEDRRLAIIEILRKYIKSSKKIRFEGDGYSESWLKEAKKRGLSNFTDTPRALDAYLTEGTKKLFAAHKILSENEIQARHETLLENYIKRVQIESRIIGDLALNHIIPTAIVYQNKLIENAKGLKELNLDNKAVIKSIEKISEHINNVRESTLQMIEERKRVNIIPDTRKKAIAYCDDVREKYTHRIRYSIDKLELFVDDEDWPLVKYRELLFLR